MGCLESKPVASKRKDVTYGLERPYHFGFQSGFHENYFINAANVLGRGTYGVVVVGHCIASGEAVAVKMVCKDRLRTPVEIRDMKHEVDICSRVCAGSLNCISLYETFEDSRMVYMVLELGAGGTLQWHRSEPDAARVSLERRCQEVGCCALRTIAQCHAKNVIYHDVKPENFVFVKSATAGAPAGMLKSIDFGLAVHHPAGSPNLEQVTGTPYFMAPEMVKSDYSYACDVWSLGVLLYMTLSGERPFNGNPALRGLERTHSVLDEITEKEVQFGSLWEEISPQARDLVNKMLVKDPTHRISAADALNHAWIREVTRGRASVEHKDRQLVALLQRYATFGAFKHRSLLTLMNKPRMHDFLQNHRPSQQLRQTFQQEFDDGAGRASAAYAAVALAKAGYHLEPNEVKGLWGIVNVTKHGSHHPATSRSVVIFASCFCN
mmetsp:Transcript_30334/g.58298  ORF Transcript_30334/g.58298 Transcript_30334/m.58298 type:complete len:437 (-) Transcript_30334:1035-2345(-)